MAWLRNSWGAFLLPWRAVGACGNGRKSGCKLCWVLCLWWLVLIKPNSVCIQWCRAERPFLIPSSGVKQAVSNRWDNAQYYANEIWKKLVSSRSLRTKVKNKAGLFPTIIVHIWIFYWMYTESNHRLYILQKESNHIYHCSVIWVISKGINATATFKWGWKIFFLCRFSNGFRLIRCICHADQHKAVSSIVFFFHWNAADVTKCVKS